MLLRFSPAVPFGLLNYLLGLTKVPLTLYVLTTLIGTTPGPKVGIYVGIIGAEAAHGAQITYLVLGLRSQLPLPGRHAAICVRKA